MTSDYDFLRAFVSVKWVKCFLICIYLVKLVFYLCNLNNWIDCDNYLLRTFIYWFRIFTGVMTITIISIIRMNKVLFIKINLTIYSYVQLTDLIIEVCLMTLTLWILDSFAIAHHLIWVQLGDTLPYMFWIIVS